MRNLQGCQLVGLRKIKITHFWGAFLDPESYNLGYKHILGISLIWSRRFGPTELKSPDRVANYKT